MAWIARVSLCSLIVVLALSAVVAEQEQADTKETVPVYTNEDLDRLFPIRSEPERAVLPQSPPSDPLLLEQPVEPGGMTHAASPQRPRLRHVEAFPASQRYRPRRDRSRQPSYVEGDVLIKFKKGVHPAEQAKIMAELGVASERQLGGGTRHLELTNGRTTEKAVAEFSGHPAVEYIEPNYKIHALDGKGGKRASSPERQPHLRGR